MKILVANLGSTSFKYRLYDLGDPAEPLLAPGPVQRIRSHSAKAMLRARFPKLPLVAAFETGFHQTIPDAQNRYAVPDEWATKYGIRRWGFHGASHRYIAGRMAELLGRDDAKIISCHLGGSSSLCA